MKKVDVLSGDGERKCRKKLKNMTELDEMESMAKYET
jgi:hypothetical protein